MQWTVQKQNDVTRVPKNLAIATKLYRRRVEETFYLGGVRRLISDKVVKTVLEVQ